MDSAELEAGMEAIQMTETEKTEFSQFFSVADGDGDDVVTFDEWAAAYQLMLTVEPDLKWEILEEMA